MAAGQGSNPVFGHVEKLVEGLARADAEKQIQQTLFQLRLKGEAEKLSARAQVQQAEEKAGAQAAQNAPATEEPNLAEQFPVQPLQGIQGKSVPTSIGDLAGTLGATGGARGGAAVQSVLKGGGTPGAVGAATGGAADPRAVGGFRAPERVRTDRTTTELQRFGGGGVIGSQYLPTTRTESVETDNVLSPADVIRAKAEEAQRAIDNRRAEETFALNKKVAEGQLSLQNREATLREREFTARIGQIKSQEKRADLETAFNISNTILKTVPGVSGEAADKATRAFLKTDIQGAYEALGSDLKKFNEAQDRVRGLEIRKLEAETIKAENEAGVTKTYTLGELGGFPVPPGKGYTPESLASDRKALFDDKGYFKPASVPALQQLNGHYINEGKLLIINEGGEDDEGERGDIVDLSPVLPALREVLATGDQQALNTVVNFRTPAGEPVFAVGPEGLGPAGSTEGANYSSINNLIVAIEKEKILASKGAQAPPAEPPSEYQRQQDALAKLDETLAELQELEPASYAVARGGQDKLPKVAQTAETQAVVKRSNPSVVARIREIQANQAELRKRFEGKTKDVLETERKRRVDELLTNAKAAELEAQSDGKVAELRRAAGVTK